MAISTEDIQWLRQETGVGMMDAKKALEAVNGDRQAAVEAMRKRGAKVAASKSERAVKEGVVGSYVHANNKVAALVAVACETDFVSRTDDFQTLGHDLALHVAAANPKYLSPEQVPAEVLAKEEEIYREQLKAEGKPEAMWDKILPGKVAKFYAETCFLKQPFVKDDSLTIEQVVQGAVAKLGENIVITGFSRLSV
jgi:elongation factor Ts